MRVASGFIGLVLVLLLLSSLGCATARPVLYDNDKLQEVGQEQANKDIDECLLAAKGAVDRKPVREAAKAGTKAAVVGGASGAAAGAFSDGETAGSGARAGAAGAAAGTAAATMVNARELNATQRSYVEQCLRDKGYQVIGWN